MINERNGIRAIELTDDDFSPSPIRLNENGVPAKLSIHLCWFDLFDEEHPNEPPYFYLRECTPVKAINCGMIRYGKTPLTYHTPIAKIDELTPFGTPVVYMRVEGDPDGLTDDVQTWEAKSIDPNHKLVIRYSSKAVHVTDGDLLNVTGIFLPWAMESHSDVGLGFPYLTGHAEYSGTYNGRKVRGLGGWDRSFAGELEANMAGRLFIGLVFIAIREDGRRECGFINQLGNGMCFYWLEGNDPITSDKVYVDHLHWEEVPYLNDGTMTFTEAVFHAPEIGLEIHYHAKYGRRGQNIIPEDRPGMGQTAGEFYVGKTPYRHKEVFCFAETHNALKSIIETQYGLQ